MKILFILCDNPFRASCGMGSSVKEIIDGLAKADESIRIQVLDLRSNDGHQTITDQIEVFSCGYRDGLGSDFIVQTLMNAPIQIIYGIKNLRRPDVIHLQDWTSIAVGNALASYWGGDIKSVYTTQLSYTLLLEDLAKESMAAPPVDQAIVAEIERLERESIQSSDRAIFLNRSDQTRLNGPHDSQVIPHGIHLGDVLSIPFEEKKLPGDHPVKLLYFGRIDTMKNVGRLLDARLPSGVDLIVMGGEAGSNPELYQRLEDLARDRDHLHRIPFTAGDDKFHIIRAADAVIFPSIHEPFGLVGLEALACGTPLIASFAGGMSGYLDEACAIRIDGLGAEAIENAIHRFMTMSDSAKEAMVRNGLNVCKRFSWKDPVERHHRLYRDLTHDGKPA
ncbi:glycosyltransferase family 4 protein [Cyanobium gracile UHCC 0139]|uniref:Glycosyltransferase family 4 protein n=1 Tax=Cyanobium gracile UHCC 0139 TaxID=3110308 RepID=A0ABU5RTW7_9CYAN|nr:glycosyltransferase family 4 protein [Cyanobium gracile]MEA5391178.1 glycosyltransferase family 4 protein [Cyanobium gracile UHCC 0139]